MGATILPETSAVKLLVDHGRVRGVRTGDRGRGRSGEELPNFEPGSDILAARHRPLRGNAGASHGRRDRSASACSPTTRRCGRSASRKCGRWRSRSTASSTRWGGRCGRASATASSAARSSIRWATTWSRSGWSSGSTTRDAELSVHDLLQELKTHPQDPAASSRAASASQWGAKTIPEGGFVALPKQLHAPGLLLCGDGAGFVNVPALKGIHYAVESGRLAAEAAFGALVGRRDARDGARLVRRRGAEELHQRAICKRCATCGRRSAAGSGSAARWRVR